MRIVLVRHSERDKNDEYVLGKKNVNVQLSENGYTIATQMANELKSKLKSNKFKIISSPLKRTMETAKIISQQFDMDNIECSTDIIEGMNIFDVIGLPEHSYKISNLSEESQLLLKALNVTYPETFDDVKNRSTKFIKSIIEMKKDVIIVTHGIIYNVIVQYFFPQYEFPIMLNGAIYKPENYFPSYCAYTILNIDDENKCSHEWSNNELNGML